MNVIINKEEYVSSDILFEKAPIYCKMVRSARELIRKNKLTSYIFLKLVDKKWTVSDGKSYKFDKVYFKKSFIDTIPEFNQEKIIIDENNIELAPNIIDLEDNEKFKDANNNIIEIETRGERKVDSIYFNGKDIMREFEMENLSKNILDKKSYFIEGGHYKYFNCKKIRNCSNNNNKTIKIKKELFLTYEGILRVLFASHSKNVKPFIKWATENLFTLHLGTKNQKEELISTILGVNAKVIKEVFNTSTNTLPCIYLFTLGTAKELRLSMNINALIPDDSIVSKYGFSKDLSRRTGEHISTYGKISNCDLKLKFHSYIDPQFISSGENDIKLFFDALKLKFDYENNDELVIIPKNLIILVEKQYQQIGKNYMGHISELVTKIKELEDKYEKASLTHQIELQNEKFKNEIQKEKYEKEIHNEKFQNEIQKEKYEKELLKKDIEVMKIQLLNINK
jgi:hypothetical protein